VSTSKPLPNFRKIAVNISSESSGPRRILKNFVELLVPEVLASSIFINVSEYLSFALAKS
jgi:hypothetical protein